jgi:hypothetical protein
VTAPAEPEIVDERFWLKRAAIVLAESAKRLDAGAAQVAIAMAWFWTAYSAAATAALAVTNRGVSLPWALLVASPACAIFVAYALATWASLPVSVAFRVIEPAQIKRAHDAVLATKRRRLSISFVFAGIAAVLVACVLVGLTVIDERHEDTAIAALTMNPSGPEVVVGGRVPVDTRVVVRVTPSGAPAVSRIVAIGKDRRFAVVVPVPVAAEYAVETSWSDGARMTIVRERVKPNE